MTKFREGRPFTLMPPQRKRTHCRDKPHGGVRTGSTDQLHIVACRHPEIIGVTKDIAVALVRMKRISD